MTCYSVLAMFLASVAASPLKPPVTSTCDNTDEAAYMQLKVREVSTGNLSRTCSTAEENCKDTKCCTDSALTCYEKHPNYAVCMASCEPGIHEDDDPKLQTPWSCNVLKPCAEHMEEDCSAVKCCKNPDDKCFEKHPRWAACMKSCEPGIHSDEDPAEQTPWSCAILSDIPRPDQPSNPSQPVTPDVSQCSDSFEEDCRDTQCCKNPGDQCYRKNELWAACMPTCTPGLNMFDREEHRTPWSCELIIPGPTSPPIVRPECAVEFSQDCRYQRCCRRQGDLCYEKNQHWAACLPNCTAGTINPFEDPSVQTPWSCNVLPECADDHKDCRDSKCCKNPASTCFQKNSGWAACMEYCIPGINYYDAPEHRTPWSCGVLN